MWRGRGCATVALWLTLAVVGLLFWSECLYRLRLML